jgi:Flp pilus assembly protein TadD
LRRQRFHQVLDAIERVYAPVVAKRSMRFVIERQWADDRASARGIPATATSTVALHDAGRTAEAERVLESVLRGRPHDRDTLSALAAFHREAGDARGSAAYLERVQALDRN